MNRAESNEIETKQAKEKINKTKSWFFEKITKLMKFQPDSLKKKVRGLKSVIFKMKKEKLQQTPQKIQKDHKRLLHLTMCQ